MLRKPSSQSETRLRIQGTWRLPWPQIEMTPLTLCSEVPSAHARAISSAPSAQQVARRVGLICFGMDAGLAAGAEQYRRGLNVTRMLPDNAFRNRLHAPAELGADALRVRIVRMATATRTPGRAMKRRDGHRPRLKRVNAPCARVAGAPAR